MARIILIALNLFAGFLFLYLGLMVREKQQAWTVAVLQFEVALQGLPLEAAPGGVPSDKDAQVPFKIAINNKAFFVDSVKRSTLQKILPDGGQVYGTTEPISSQEAEIARVEKIVTEATLAGDSAAQRAALLRYLLNFARTGRERDGAIALLRDLVVPARAASARLSVHLAAPDEGSSNALAPLALLPRLGDPAADTYQASLADLRASVAVFIRAEAMGLIPVGTAADARVELSQKLTNAADGLVKAIGSGGDVAAARAALIEAAPETGKEQAGRIADAASGAATPTEDSLTRLRASLEAYAQTAAVSAESKKAVESIARISTAPAGEVETEAIVAAKALLARYFDEAKTPSAGEKVAQRLAIAHLLYFLDADSTFYAPASQAEDSTQKADAEVKTLAETWTNRLAWHQRVRYVVGAGVYNSAAQAQVTRLELAVRRVQGLLVEEQGDFIPVYDQLRQRASALAASLQTARGVLQNAKLLSEQYTTEANERKVERMKLETDLTELRQANAARGDELGKREDRLLKLELEIVAAQDELLQIEVKLRELESRRMQTTRDR